MLLAIRRRLLGASGDDARDQDEGGTTNIHTLLIYSRCKQLREPNCFRIVFHGPAQTAGIGASQSDKQGSSRQSALASPAGITDAKLCPGYFPAFNFLSGSGWKSRSISSILGCSG